MYNLRISRTTGGVSGAGAGGAAIGQLAAGSRQAIEGRACTYPCGALYGAVVAIRYNPHVKAVCDRLQARGKSKKTALDAAMRKLVYLCFGVLKTKMPYQHNYAKIA